MVCDFKIRKVKDIRRKFVPRGKKWKLHEDSIKSDFRSYINKYGENSQKHAPVGDYWKVLKGALIEATHRSGLS